MTGTADQLRDIRGMFVPMPCVFDGHGELDEELYGSMCREYVRRGANALFLMGSVGQGMAMRPDQRMRALEVAVAAVGPAVPLVPNIGAVDPYSACELGRHARAQGVPAVAVVGPYYYSDRSHDELVMHFQMIDEAVGLPIVIYNNPEYQGYNITPALTTRLREAIPGVCGMKIARPNLTEIIGYRASMGPDFKIFAPTDNLMPGMLLGQTGSVSPPLLMAPEVGAAFFAAIDKNDTEEALRLHLAMMKFSNELKKLAKWGRAVQLEGLRYAGFAVRQYPRWPIAPMPAAEITSLHASIDELGSVLA